MKGPAAPLFDFSASELVRNRLPLTHVVILIWEAAQRVGGQWLHNGQAGSRFFFVSDKAVAYNEHFGLCTLT